MKNEDVLLTILNLQRKALDDLLDEKPEWKPFFSPVHPLLDMIHRKIRTNDLRIDDLWECLSTWDALTSPVEWDFENEEYETHHDVWFLVIRNWLDYFESLRIEKEEGERENEMVE